MVAPVVTLSSDFEKQSVLVAELEAAVYRVNPGARVIHLMHGIRGFDVVSAAKALESVAFMPRGFHVCVVDPGVGTTRRGLIVRVKRGDCLVGPDNGCLLTAPRFLGGVECIVEISNEAFVFKPVSPVFHGRDVFAPVAAYLSKGVPLEEFGEALGESECVAAPFEEAVVEGGAIKAMVIDVNRFGSITLNVLAREWDRLSLGFGESVLLSARGKSVEAPFVRTFGDVAKGKPLVFKDEHGRIEVAVNQGSFVETLPLNVGDVVFIERP